MGKLNLLFCLTLSLTSIFFVTPKSIRKIEETPVPGTNMDSPTPTPTLRLCKGKAFGYNNVIDLPNVHFQFLSLNQALDRVWLQSSEEFAREFVDLNCGEFEMKLDFELYEFAMLPTNDLMVLSDRYLIAAEDTCLNAYAAEYYDEPAKKVFHDINLQAEICFPMPFAPFCCPSGQVVRSMNNKPLSCVETKNSAAGKHITLSGSDKFNVSGKVTGFPSCTAHMSLAYLDEELNYGSLEINDYKYNFKHQLHGETILRKGKEFCLGRIEDSLDEDGLTPVVAFCRPFDLAAPCTGEVCFSKCCPDGYFYDTTLRSCVEGDTDDIWDPVVDPESQEFTHGMPYCKSPGAYVYLNLDESDDSVSVKSDGDVVITPLDLTLSAPSYCLDYFRNRDDLHKTLVACSDLFPKPDSTL